MYVSGAIAGKAPRSEPDMALLVTEFQQIQVEFGERFVGSFWHEFLKVADDMEAEGVEASLQRVEARRQRREAFQRIAVDTRAKPMFVPVANEGAAVPEKPA